MDAQKSFLFAAKQLDEFIDKSCKSGTDRTSAMDDYMKADFIFSRVRGRRPESRNKEDQAAINDIMTKLGNVSASQDNTAFNRGMPGMLVSEKTTPGGPRKPGKMHSNTIKEVRKVIKESCEEARVHAKSSVIQEVSAISSDARKRAVSGLRKDSSNQ